MTSPVKSQILDAYFDELTSRYDWALDDLDRLEMHMHEARKRLGLVRSGSALQLSGPAWLAALRRAGLAQDQGLKVLRTL